MKKKTMWVLVVSALSMVLFLSGCSSSEKSGGQSGDKTIKLMWWGSKDRNDMTSKAIKQFEKENPNINVTPQFSGWDGYWSKLSTQVGGGTIPDVIQMDKKYLRNYATRGVLKDLSGLDINFDALDSGSVNSGKINEELYGIPTGVNAITLIYDPAMLKKAGITIDSEKSMSWTDYANIAEKISKNLPDTYGTQNEMGWMALFKFYARDHGEHLYIEGENSVKLGFSKQTMTDWFNYWLDLQEEGVAPPAEYTASFNWGEIEKFPIVKKKTPFSFAFSNQYPTIEKFANRDLKMAMSPSLNNGNKPYFLKPSMYWSISKDTKHPKASAKLVNYLLNSSKAVEIIGTDRGVPINTSFRKELTKSATGAKKEVISFVNHVGEVAGDAPPVDASSAGQLVDLLNDISQKVQFKQLSPKEATNQFFDKAKSALSEDH
ncbi:ABC transporter substrate-binding protein [Tuberibacillus sp. Marseille-P3662]|uniref:ABC transporter substrate-binding protein n=1 Tax=Tuberibacillus sp. Marseille-P3662 TaxID=1965358 RepID=UPI000A1CD3D0|nr:ABC transporter substrate-binding protein [Tuberibacillus sp. Marseille-P3662]